jgi:hypothetical protein
MTSGAKGPSLGVVVCLAVGQSLVVEERAPVEGLPAVLQHQSSIYILYNHTSDIYIWSLSREKKVVARSARLKPVRQIGDGLEIRNTHSNGRTVSQQQIDLDGNITPQSENTS